MSKSQVKKYEVELFDSIATAGDYNLTKLSQYNEIDKILRSNRVDIRGTILDAGCGTGHAGKFFLKKYPMAKVFGVDISPKMIQQANKNSKRFTGIVGDLENRKLFREKSIDNVICFLVLHHFPNPSKVFENFSKWIKKRGYIIISEPNGENIIGIVSHAIRIFIESTFGKDYLIQTKTATPNETVHSLRKYEQLLKKNGFRVVDHVYYYTEPDVPLSFSLGGIRSAVSRLLHLISKKHKLFQTDVLIIARQDL